MMFSGSPQPVTLDETASRTAQDMSLSVLNGVNPSIYTDLILSSGLLEGHTRDVSKLDEEHQSKFAQIAVSMDPDILDSQPSQDANAASLSEGVGVESGVTTQSGDTIYLFTDPIRANVILGRVGQDGVSASSGDVAFALFLEDGSDRSPAGFWIVEYAAMFNSDPDIPNNPINALSVHAQENAGERAAFTFDGVDWVVKAFIKIME